MSARTTLVGLLHKLPSIFLRDYALYRVYALDSPPSLSAPPTHVCIQPNVDSATLERSPSQILRRLSAWGGSESNGFTLCSGEDTVAVCWYWYGERYRQSRNFWPLQSGEAKLIELGTREDARGAGYASMLIAESSRRMFEGGFTRLFARIWHSNEPSLRAFEKAGWRNVAFIAELEIMGVRRKFRFDLRHRFFLRHFPTGRVSQPVMAVRS